MRLLLALAAVLLLPTAAEAAGPKITWPEQRTYAPGEKLTVKVVSSKPVQVSLVRQSERGKVLRTIARRTLRRGTFSARLPQPGRYSLRVGSRHRDFKVGRACPTPAGDRAELRLGAAAVRAGETLAAEVVNTSRGCVMGGAGYLFERLQPDGSWARVPTNLVFVAVGLPIQAGKSQAKPVPIPADFVPGSYRLRDTVFGAKGRIDLTAPFEVVG